MSTIVNTNGYAYVIDNQQIMEYQSCHCNIKVGLSGNDMFFKRRRRRWKADVAGIAYGDYEAKFLS